MGVKGGAKCAKYFLFILNTIFFLAGALLLAIGLWLRFDERLRSIYLEQSQNAILNTTLGLAFALQTAWAIFVAFGAFTFAVGFCGCCGAIKESRWLLGFYVAFIIAIMAGELGGGIYAFMKFREVTKKIDEVIEEDLKSNYNNQTSLINDALMTEFNCCGWNEYTDFNFTSHLPRPCCIHLPPNSSCSAYPVSNIYGGCKSLIVELFEYAGKIFIGVGIGLALLEIIVLIAGIALCCSIERY